MPPLVVQVGRDGQLTRVYRYTGESESGAPVLEIVASARQDEIVNIGTRERPAFVAPAFYGDPITGGIPESVWVALAQCESGGRPSVISAGGRFHGLYQFSVATWRSVGGEGLPSQASPEEQRYRAVRLQARSGWGQWRFVLSSHWSEVVTPLRLSPYLMRADNPARGRRIGVR